VSSQDILCWITSFGSLLIKISFVIIKSFISILKYQDAVK